MRKRLEKMPESFSQKDIEKLSGGFEKIDKSASITSAERERIMSSVMRKAGIDMNDTGTRDNIKVTRGFKGIGVAAAAAVVLIAGISAVSLSGRIKDDGSSLRAAQAVNDSSNTIGDADSQTVVFTSIEGKTLKLGKTTYEGEEYADRESVKIFNSGEEDDRTVVMTLIFTNGERQDICVRDITDMHYGYLEFAHFDIDPTAVSTVVINGKAYSQNMAEDEADEMVQWDYEEKSDSITNDYTLTQHFKLTKYYTYNNHGTLELGFLTEALDDEGSEIIANNRDKLLVYLGVTDKQGNTYCLSDDTIEMTDDSDGKTFVREYISIPSYKETLKDYDLSHMEAVWLTVDNDIIHTLRDMDENNTVWADGQFEDNTLGKVTFSLEDYFSDTPMFGSRMTHTWDYGDDLYIRLCSETQNDAAIKKVEDNRDSIGVYIRTYRKDGTAESAAFKKGENIEIIDHEDGSYSVRAELMIKEYKEALKDLDAAHFDAVWFVWDDSMSEDMFFDPFWNENEQYKGSVLGVTEFSTSEINEGMSFIANYGDEENELYALVGYHKIKCDGLFDEGEIDNIVSDKNSDRVIITVNYENGAAQDIRVSDISDVSVEDIDSVSVDVIEFDSVSIDYLKAVSVNINGTVYKPM